jgi:hypothetical protein
MHSKAFYILAAAALIELAYGISSLKQDSNALANAFRLNKKRGGDGLSTLAASSTANANRLALRGGGFPVLLLGTAAAITATATNEEIRSRFMKALSNIRIGPYQLKHKAKPKKTLDQAAPKLALTTQSLNVRNGTWAVEATDEVEVSIAASEQSHTYEV